MIEKAVKIINIVTIGKDTIRLTFTLSRKQDIEKVAEEIYKNWFNKNFILRFEEYSFIKNLIALSNTIELACLRNVKNRLSRILEVKAQLKNILLGFDITKRIKESDIRGKD